LTLRYLALKVGYNPDVKEEFEKAMELYQEKHEIITDSYETYKYICLITESLMVEQLQNCIKRNKPIF